MKRKRPANQPDALLHARNAYENGDWARAELLCREQLTTRDADFEALNLLGIITLQTARAEEAAGLLGRAVAARPGDAAAHSNYGNALKLLGRLAEALAQYERAVQLKPDFAEPCNNLGVTLQALGRSAEALASYDRALALAPGYAEALNNRGNALKQLHRPAEALASYERALAIKPDYAKAHNNRGNVLKDLERADEALVSYARALAINPGYSEAYSNRGNALSRLRRFGEALEDYGRALALKPDYAEAWSNRGAALHELRRYAEALESHGRAVALKPDYAEAYFNRAATLKILRRDDEAQASYARALAIRPDYEWLYGTWLSSKMQLCDWEGLGPALAELEARITSGQHATPPFPVLALVDSLALQRRAAETWVAANHPPRPLPADFAPRASGGRIRLGYYSADFHNHATAYLMAELIEQHDRERFELVAFSFGPDTGDGMRARLTKAFDRFIDVRALSDQEIAGQSRELAIDIAVDLKGFTQEARTGVFARRAGPVQVSYLGFPATMAAPYIDYLIADHTLVPEASRRHYAEKIAYLPGSYQVNDSRRPMADRVFTRSELGLPASGLVFACFNNSYKITPDTFTGWMRILTRVPGSVLWLLEDNPVAASNLRRAAEVRGVHAPRLVFAPRMPLPEHLARHRAADLFLDTLPCNAHTTASDALWAGLPVLTLMGESFASRVAGSLLNAVGMPELVTTDQAHYEALAVALASDPGRLAALRARLHENRMTAPLFATSLYTRQLENAYLQMYERQQAGLGPGHIFVAR
jgi:predicted O-linked N-acetylglucosamine transferase (SPINDLY family)